MLKTGKNQENKKKRKKKTPSSEKYFLNLTDRVDGGEALRPLCKGKAVSL